jgi:LPS export ABC transporter protein LptC
MQRARVRGLLIAVVLVVLTGIGFLLGRTMLSQKRAMEQVAAERVDPEVSQSIRQFHRVKVEDGRMVWDLRAEKADFLDVGRVVVEEPKLSFYTDDGRAVELSGALGEVTLRGPDVERIDLRGDIDVTVGRYRLRTPEASWIDALNSVVAASGVELTGGGVELTGDAMVVELDTQRVVVAGGVQTVFSPRGEEADAEATEKKAPAAAPRVSDAPAKQPSQRGKRAS